MKTRTAAVLVGLSLWLATARGQESLPPGPGQQLVLNACVQCHDLRWVTSQHKSETAWRRTVNEMLWRGAPLLPGEVDIITRYLTNSSGGQPSPAARSANDVFLNALPTGRGRALVLSACVQCHDLGVTVSQRKALREWQRSVEQMAHLGARLNGHEIDVVAHYLAEAFGPQK